MNPSEALAVFGTLGGLVALTAAVLIFRTAPDRRVAWRFGALLIFEALMIWTTRVGPLYWLDTEGLDRVWLRMHFANDGFLIATYLPALAVVIHSRLLVPFESNRVAVVMFGLALIHAVLVFAYPDLYVSGDGLIPYKQRMLDSAQPAVKFVYGSIVLSYTFGLIATLLARRSAQGRLARHQASVLALAFGARDLTWGLIYSVGMYLLVFGVRSGGGTSLLFGVLATGGLFTYVCLTTYGILSEHLFDIDIKIKWTLERGTIAAIFIAVFFMVSEGASALLSDQFGSLLGILATGALVFAMTPLQRAVERLADHTIPSVRDTPGYKNYKKLQIYGEAVAEAMQDGVISRVERVVLNRLRVQLDLEEAIALDIEHELTIAGPNDPAVAGVGSREIADTQ